ncbi:MAG: DUF3618 domain-containing protein [Actinophytocola sp.]|nr:DUF3618 domain-containing protein [Actinophytocola sp.]
MGRDQESIQRDIEKSREGLVSSVDQLAIKLSPKRLADNAKTTARGKLDRPAVKYPLIGAGVLVGLLLLRKLWR